MAAEQREQMEMEYQHVSPLDSGDESDLDNDLAVRTARDSTEVANHDREILDEEEEREKLLASSRKAKPSKGFFATSLNIEVPHEKAGQHQAKRRRKKKNGDIRDEEGTLMYEMEEGGPVSDISSQASGSSLELDKLNPEKRPTSRVS